MRIVRRVSVPVIASLNGTTTEGWLDYSHLVERAGGAAIELNFYAVPTDGRTPARVRTVGRRTWIRRDR